MIRLLKANCEPKTKNYIFDGYPRNLEQAQTLESQVLLGHNFKVIYFDMNPNQLVARLTNRRVCSGCQRIYNLLSEPPRNLGVCDACGAKVIQREDDKEEVIRHRIKVYEEKIAPLLDYYKAKEVLSIVNAVSEVSEVYNQIQKVMI